MLELKKYLLDDEMTEENEEERKGEEGEEE